MESMIPSRVLAAVAPRATMIFGRITSTCRIRKGEQVSISSRSGARFCGGRHFTTLAMYTSSRRSPMAAIMLLSSCPARPTKGSPCSSSSAPGPSPINMISARGFPTPKTMFLRPRLRPQRVQSPMSSRMARSAVTASPAGGSACKMCKSARSGFWALSGNAISCSSEAGACACR